MIMTGREIEWAQRISVLETKMEALAETSERVEEKLNELLQLRSKGVGAFWVASTLLGSGIMGSLLVFIDWFKGLKF